MKVSDLHLYGGLDEFNKLMIDLKNIGKILDKEHGMILLASLPKS